MPPRPRKRLRPTLSDVTLSSRHRLEHAEWLAGVTPHPHLGSARAAFAPLSFFGGNLADRSEADRVRASDLRTCPHGSGAAP